MFGHVSLVATAVGGSELNDVVPIQEAIAEASHIVTAGWGNRDVERVAEHLTFPALLNLTRPQSGS